MITKVCRRADCPLEGAAQPIDHFATDKRRPDGRHPYCRTCRSALAARRIASNPESRLKAKEAQARYRASEHGSQRLRETYLSAEYRERVNPYAREYAKRPEVKARLAEKRRAYAERNRLKECARHAVAYALRKGRLTKTAECQWCGVPAPPEQLEAHHWRGYEPDAWLDVKFVHADPCHLRAHNLPEGAWP